MRFSLAILLLLLCSGVSRCDEDVATEAQDADRQAKDAFYILSCADEARDEGNYEEAAILYKAALKAYEALFAEAADWEPRMVRFRTTYCSNQLTAVVDVQLPGNMTLRELPDVEMITPTELSVPEAAPDEPETPTIADPEKLTTMDLEEPTEIKVGSVVPQLLQEGQIEAARGLLLESLRETPDSQNIRLLLGVVQCRAGEFNDAVFLLEELVEDAPTNALGHICLGTAYFGLGRLIEAADAMKNALALHPSLGAAHYNLAQILLRMEPPDLATARRHYQKSLELGGKADPRMATLVKSEQADAPLNGILPSSGTPTHAEDSTGNGLSVDKDAEDHDEEPGTETHAPPDSAGAHVPEQDLGPHPEEVGTEDKRHALDDHDVGQNDQDIPERGGMPPDNEKDGSGDEEKKPTEGTSGEQFVDEPGEQHEGDGNQDKQ